MEISQIGHSVLHTPSRNLVLKTFYLFLKPQKV
jgi:hypothetical protein